MTKEFRASVKRLHLLTVHFQTVVAPRELPFFFFFLNGISCIPLLKVAGEELLGYFGERIILERFYKQTSLM